ncbi:carboxypeptidase-like regulatory domain-containing protein [Hymenobacter volaticus]|uniref:Carboxypeptidase-like regulatory domain-containing protein n=1 Tax=Hymenobacter volaticus TaxID=2932254 RepID=A0ABY4G8E6_9BACT|nr:carboxypeptidase-like regulatory domain-containing protein [Hymenobacter volaticus]UOQ67178.1 carboxypeptidase-like regulatory domain-containing protein [Hymenobacter volaticus]
MLPSSYKNLLLRSAVLFAASEMQTFVLQAAARPIGEAPEATLPASIANVRVSGRVLTATGEGLPGVTVVVKGSSVGTSTDGTGAYSLDVPEGGTLVFSYVGYIRKEVPVTGATTSLDVTLSEDKQSLKEVVVVGYGTQERASVTGAVASVSGREIAAQPVADASQAIQGRAAGCRWYPTRGSGWHGRYLYPRPWYHLGRRQQSAVRGRRLSPASRRRQCPEQH